MRARGTVSSAAVTATVAPLGFFGCLRFCQRGAWALLQDGRWPRPNLGPGYKCTPIGAVTGGTAAALFLEQKVCELSIQPHTAVSLHQIEHYRKWMGAETHDCSHWLMMHQFNSLIFFFSFSLLELLCPTSEEWAAMLHNCEDIFRQIMFCRNLEDKHGQRGWNDTSLSPPLWHHWINCTLAPFINVHLMENKGNYKLHPVFQHARQDFRGRWGVVVSWERRYFTLTWTWLPLVHWLSLRC